jgi:hypothetical protein
MAKKKIDTPKARTKAAKDAAKARKTSEPKSNVYVYPDKASKAANKRYNKSSGIKTRAAKMGIDMTDKAINTKKTNAKIRAEGKTSVVKIRSGGLGGMYNPKNK